MPTFIMFGKYSAAAMKGMSAERTKKAVNLLKKHGGKVKEMYALLGEKDLLLIVDFPGVDAAIKASVGLSKMSGLSFATFPAVNMDEFDKLISQI